MGQILITESISFPNTATAGGYIEVFMTVSDSVSDICGGYGIKMHYISTGWSPCTGDFKLYNGTTKRELGSQHVFCLKTLRMEIIH